MSWFDRKFKEKLVMLGIDVVMIKRYVDDYNLAVMTIAASISYDQAPTPPPPP